MRMISKKKILLVPDVDWWVFYKVAKVIKEALKEDFDVRIALSCQNEFTPVDCEDADLILFWNYDYYVNWDFPFPKYSQKTFIRVCAFTGIGTERFPERVGMTKGLIVSCELLKEHFAKTGVPTFYIPDFIEIEKFHHIHEDTLKNNFQKSCWGWAGREQGNIKGYALMQEAAKTMGNFKCAKGDKKDDDMPQFYKELSVYANMSQSEGTPLTVLEACATA